MKTVGTDIWVAEHPSSTLGIEYGVRMTVIRLANSDLVLISPITLTEELAAEISKLGTVKYLIAPNSFHHMFIAPWVSKFPNAELWVVPQLVKKRQDLRPTRVIDESPLALWSDELKVLFIPGGKLYSETVFCHKASRTLIVTDLCFNLRQKQGFLATLLLKAYGIYKKFGPSKAVAIFMGDKAKLKNAIEQISTWDFNRVIVAHGEIWENTTPAAFAKSFEAIL